ncbi:toprim domain-containing protein, partial [Candidatus Shapirobacteria bacterium]|nr:toprim domain-containing protein [Candidatus Shapirobacteria bacterium]
MTQEESKKKILYEINREAAKFYHYILTKHSLGKEALEYLHNRELKEDTIKKFMIGFSPKDSRLVVNYLLKKGYKIEEMVATGSFGVSQYNRKQIYDRFQDRVIFPQIDFRERIVGFSGRILPTATNKNLAKYINSPETDVYHKSQMLFGLNLAKEAVKKENWALVVEGELDMISPYQIGMENVVAIKGTALTEDQLHLMSRYTDTIILGLDSDFAGNKASIRSIELAEKMDFEIKVLDLEGKYKDPDEAIKNNPDFFKKKIAEAKSIWDFLIFSSVKNYGTDTIKGKKMILTTVLPFLAKINNSVIKSDYINKLASELGSDEEGVANELKKYTVDYKKPEETQKISVKEPMDKKERLEERMMILALASKNPKKIIKKIEWREKRFIKIAKVIKRFKLFKAVEIVKQLETELVDIFNNLYLQAIEEKNEASERNREINNIIKQIEEINLKDRLKTLSGIIANLEVTGNEKEMAKTEAEYAQTLTRLALIQKGDRS